MDQQNKIVLLVDDNAVLRKALRVMFEAAGFTCAESQNGAQGLEQADELQPDLIVLDFSMPVMNGLEAAPRFKKKFPHIPIVMFTMFANDAFAKLAASAGVTAVISKENAATHLLPKVVSLLKSPSE